MIEDKTLILPDWDKEDSGDDFGGLEDSNLNGQFQKLCKDGGEEKI